MIPVEKNMNSRDHSRQPTIGFDETFAAASWPRNHHNAALIATATMIRPEPPAAGMPRMGITGNATIVSENHTTLPTVPSKIARMTQPITNNASDMAIPARPPARFT